MSLEHNWLDDGGWYLLLPSSLLSDWHGGYTDDYDCYSGVAPSSWLAQLPIGNNFGLALGGDPVMACVSPQSDGTAKLIRWLYSESEDELIAFALCGEFVKQSEPDIIFDNHESEWLLFNAAADPIVNKPPMLHIPFPTGRVRIQTALLEHSTNAAIVHTIGCDRHPTQRGHRSLSGKR